MVIPGWVAQWSTVATFLGSILGGAFVIYQWRNHARKTRMSEDESLEIKANRQARTEFKVEDLEESVRDHEVRIMTLEKAD